MRNREPWLATLLGLIGACTSVSRASVPAADGGGAAPLPLQPTALPDTRADAGAAIAMAMLDASVTPARARSSVIDSESWRQAEASEDPWSDRPAQVQCPDLAALPELFAGQMAFGVDTGACHYFTGVQATLRNVLPGDELRVVIAHFELTAPSPAQAHVAVQIAGMSIIDERVQIPQPGAVIMRRVRSEQRIPAGAPIYFHLHNHGANSWAIVEVSTGP